MIDESTCQTLTLTKIAFKITVNVEYNETEFQEVVGKKHYTGELNDTYRTYVCNTKYFN